MRKPIDKIAMMESFAKRYEHRPSSAKIVSHIASLYEDTKHLLAEDPTFDDELFKGSNAKFQQRYWEMLLAQQLAQRGAHIAHMRSGPDFMFDLDGRKIWIEAVAPDRTPDIDAYYRTEALNRGGWFSPDIFHLRWTQALDEKLKKFAAYMAKGQVGSSDICVIAVNSGLLGSLGMTGKSDYPALIEVVFGVGAEYAAIDRETMKVVDQGYGREPTITKKNGSPVSKRFFLNNDARHVSAIVASGTTPELWLPSIAVYNPFAYNSLPRGHVGAHWEYYVENCNGRLEVRNERMSGT